MKPNRINLKIQNSILLFPAILMGTLVFLILFALPLSMFPTAGESPKESVEEFTARLNKRIPAIMEDYKIPDSTSLS